MIINFEKYKRIIVTVSCSLLLLPGIWHFRTSCLKGGFCNCPPIQLCRGILSEKQRNCPTFSHLGKCFDTNEENGWYIDLVGFRNTDSPRATKSFHVASNITWHLDNSCGYNNVSIQIGIAESWNKLEVHPILQGKGLIPDPQHGYNEITHVSWIRTDTWKFTARFEVPKGLQAQNIFMDLSQIDTIGTVILNEKIIGHVSNMHRKYIFPLDSELFSTTSRHMELSIVLFSPVAKSEELFDSQEYLVPHTQQKFSVGHFNMIRKSASDFGWDWGPAMVPFGILGHVALISTPCSSVLESIVTRQDHLSDASVAIHVDLIIQKVFKSMERMQRVRVNILLSPPDSGGSTAHQSYSTAVCKPFCGPYSSFRDKTNQLCLLKCTGASIRVNNPVFWSAWDHSSVQKQPLYRLQVNVSLIFVGTKAFKPNICRYSRDM